MARHSAVDFAMISTEQRMIVETVRTFVQKELAPHEQEVEETGEVAPDLAQAIKEKALAAGIYAANMPVELGGGGLDNLTMALVERELGKTSYGLQYIVARPSNILRACTGDQVDRYLLPTIRGERVECLAMSEPDAGSDLRGMQCRAVRDGHEFAITGTKHFISHADVADFVILFAATGEDESVGGRKKRITSFLVDMGTPGFEVRPGYQSVSHRGYNNSILYFDDCRVPDSQILGEEHRGFELANSWLGSTRLQVAASCWAGPIGPSPSPPSGPHSAISSVSRSESSRGFPSSSPTWRPGWRRQSYSLTELPGGPIKG